MIFWHFNTYKFINDCSVVFAKSNKQTILYNYLKSEIFCQLNYE